MGFGRRRDEQGAMAVMIALIACVVMVPLAAVAVDLGVQRVARRDMQSMADVVALDLGRDVDGSKSAATLLAEWSCSASTAGTCTAASGNRVGKSVARNTSTAGDAPNVLAALGCIDKTTGAFSPVNVTCINPDGVKVSATTAVKFNLQGGEGGAVRTAIATSKQSACYYLGSFAARVNSGDSSVLSPMNDFLGLNLDLVSYQGLADADLTLAELAATSQIGGVDELLGGGITLGDLIAASYEVLNAQGEPENAVALALLNNPAGWLGADLDTTIQLDEILGIDTADQAALNADVSLLDLLGGAIQLVNGEQFLSASDIGIPNVLTVNTLKVIQGKRWACRRGSDMTTGKAEADQVKLELRGSLSGLSSLIPGVGLQGIDGNFTVKADVGSADAALIGPETVGGVLYPSIHCGNGTAVDPDKYNVEVANGLASSSVAVTVNLHGKAGNVTSVVQAPVLTSLLNSLLGGLVSTVVPIDVTYNLSVSFAATNDPAVPSGTAHLQVPQNSLNNDKADPPLADGTAVTVGNDAPLQLPTLPTTPTVQGTVTVKVNKLGLLGGLLGTNDVTVPITTTALAPILTGVQNAVNNAAQLGAITGPVNNLLADVHDLLGLTLGGSDVYGDYRPECNGTSLIG